jgi:hypothetical protein
MSSAFGSAIPFQKNQSCTGRRRVRTGNVGDIDNATDCAEVVQMIRSLLKSIFGAIDEGAFNLFYARNWRGGHISDIGLVRFKIDSGETSSPKVLCLFYDLKTCMIGPRTRTIFYRAAAIGAGARIARLSTLASTCAICPARQLPSLTGT